MTAATATPRDQVKRAELPSSPLAQLLLLMMLLRLAAMLVQCAVEPLTQLLVQVAVNAVMVPWSDAINVALPIWLDACDGMELWLQACLHEGRCSSTPCCWQMDRH
eukprot:GHUV01015500.1.p4 GENE.GHUV01015500.1~~GHUV01015500.1.p4  ORF type:complete len:106 (-),score=29.22 GHUV01015500.1:784-1101(-)